MASQCRLKVTWDWVVDSRLHTVFSQVCLKSVAVGSANDIKVKYVILATQIGSSYGERREPSRVLPRVFAPSSVVLVEMGKLQLKDGRLHFVHPSVHPHFVVVVALSGSVVTKCLKPVSQLIAVRHDAASLAVRA